MGGLLGYAIWVRYTGLTLTMGVVAALAYAKNRRDATKALLTSMAIGASLAVRNFSVAHRLTGYPLTWQNMLSDIARPSAFLNQWQKATHMIFVNDLFAVNLPNDSLGFTLRWFLVIVWMTMVWKALKPWKRFPIELRAQMVGVAVFVLLSYGIYIGWTSQYSRYALPTMPFISLLFVMGCVKHYKTLPSWLRKGWIAAACTIAIFYAKGNADFMQRISTPHPGLASLEMTSRWIHEQVPAQALFLYVKPAELYLYTNHPSIDYQFTNNREHFRYLALTKGVTYLLARPFWMSSAGVNAARAWNLNQLWAASWPDAFKKVYQNPEEATTLYEVIPSTRFLNAFALYQQASQDFDSGSFSEGLEKLDQSLSVEPTLISSLNAYGAGCALSGKNLKTGEVKLKKALRLAPHHALILLNLSRLYRRMGQSTLARQRFQEAEAAARSSFEFQYLLPTLEAERGRLTQPLALHQ